VLVPGALQTQPYTESILEYLRGPKNEDRIRAYVELRSLRMKQLLTDNTEGRLLKFLLDESVIRRVIGGHDVMIQQLSRLLEVAQLPFVMLRVVPFHIGMYRSLRVPFVVLEFPSPEQEDLLYLEYPERARVVRPKDVPPGDENPTAPSTYLEIFAELENITSEEESRALLESTLRDLRRQSGDEPQAPTEPSSSL
jgi:hypothetical protein